MRTLFALGVGAVLGTAVALWIAAQRDLGRLSDPTVPVTTIEPPITPSATAASPRRP